MPRYFWVGTLKEGPIPEGAVVGARRGVDYISHSYECHPDGTPLKLTSDSWGARETDADEA